MYGEKTATIHTCVIIPTYNNARTLQRIVDGVLHYTQDVIIVNDGSTDDTENILKKYPKLTTIHFPENRGKGLALRTGLHTADRLGFDYAITIDSDGQHYPDDIPAFINEIEAHGPALLIGARDMNQDGVPGKSSFGNRFSNFWFQVETGIRLSDTQSGYRLYPVKLLRPIRFYTTKFEFEVEVIVRAAWRAIPVRNIPIKVLYDPSERVSHFRPFRDFTRISILNIWLVLVSLLYIHPIRFFRKIRHKGWRRFFLEDLLQSKDSKRKKSLSVALGIFIGISPFWGFHTLLVFLLAFAFRLNKLIAFAFSNISLPPFIPFILYASFRIGSLILGQDHRALFRPEAFDSYSSLISRHLAVYIAGSLILAAGSAVVAGILSYFLLSLRNRRTQQK